MREIQLTQGKMALVDDETFEELNQFKWYAFKGHNTFYVCRQPPMINGERGTIIHMHHEIIGKPPKGFETDHRNGQGLDNQRHNLRHVTHRQNQQNRKQKGSSQYPGVYWVKKDKRWMARIVINGVSKYLGVFTNEYEAFETYKRAVNAIGEKMIGELKCL